MLTSCNIYIERPFSPSPAVSRPSLSVSFSLRLSYPLRVTLTYTDLSSCEWFFHLASSYPMLELTRY